MCLSGTIVNRETEAELVSWSSAPAFVRRVRLLPSVVIAAFDLCVLAALCGREKWAQRRKIGTRGPSVWYNGISEGFGMMQSNSHITELLIARAAEWAARAVASGMVRS
jgi:hypothetical protein